MDATIAAVYGHLLRHHGCSVDDILEAPELRTVFLAEARRLLGDLPKRDLLHRLTILRKRSKLPRCSDLADPQPDPYGPAAPTTVL